MSHLENNLFNLKKRFPLLHAFLMSQDIIMDLYPVELSKEGSPTILINGNYVHSRFNPIRESERYIKNEISNEAGFIIFAGFGLAYHIEYFLKSYENINFLIVEHDVQFFLHALSARDFKEVILSERVQFLIGTEPEDCGIILEQNPGKVIQLLKLRSVYDKNEDFYKNLDIFIQNYVSRKEINLSTLKRFGKLWVRNLAVNARQLAIAPGINRIRGRFCEIPALLIAAGPSLDRIKPYLHELKQRFLIVAVDTALRACLEENIEPDFTVVVDPQYWNSRHLDRCYTNETILLSEISTYPSVFRQVKGKVFLCSTDFPLGLFMEGKTEIKGKLKAGGSVATAAWDFCRTLSITEIWCAGLDLGFPGKQTHFKGSFFEQRAHWLSDRTFPSESMSWHALIDAGLKKIESNSGNITWTDKRMSIYSRWFEEQMEKYKTVQSWNLSDEGIKINGMPQRDIKAALALPPVRKSIDLIIKEIKNIHTEKELHNQLENIFQNLIHELTNLNDLATEGMNLITALEKSFNKKENLQLKLNELSNLDEKILHSVSKDIAGFILQNFINNLLKNNHQNESSEIIANSFNLYKELHDSSTFHLDLLNKSLKTIKNT
ncbi:MAG: DUF115 domain-containing protein [Spirochaetaceae bacterium]|jgi:hypothetical protein|nr:DUF115 domain-containing protein [Spirochaetaceae bacterium]